MIPVSRPSINHLEIEEIMRVFETGWLGLGATVFEFERELKEYLGSKNVIAVNTGTSALHIALDSLGIKTGDEVLTPSLTFCAGIQVITLLGAIPVFCEVNPNTLNIDLDDAKKRISKKTKVIMPVHYCGNPCDMDAIIHFSNEYGIRIIEDAAHAFGSSYKGKKIGSIGDLTCFSFDPIKNITCGEGGAVVLSDDNIAEVIRKKRILGIDKDTWHRYRNERSWFYEVTTQGYRYHMSNINAAIGLAQLKKLENFIAKKRSIVKIYNESFSNLNGIELLDWNLDETAPFTYIIRIVNGKRDRLIDYLNSQGISSGIHYIANHVQPFFKNFSTQLPISEKINGEILTLPLYFDMTENDIQKVITSIVEFFQ